MKTIIISALIIWFLPSLSKADFNHTFCVAADTSQQKKVSDLLIVYYNLKDALVNGNASAASASAGEFLEAVNNIDTKSLSESDKKSFISLQAKLAFDARHISEVKAIDHQREHFASLSSNMYKLAKTIKLSADPVYEVYCPMKKTYWLSKDATIKNPYYGKQMLSCGKVVDTIK